MKETLVAVGVAVLLLAGIALAAAGYYMAKTYLGLDAPIEVKRTRAALGLLVMSAGATLITAAIARFITGARYES